MTTAICSQTKSLVILPPSIGCDSLVWQGHHDDADGDGHDDEGDSGDGDDGINVNGCLEDLEVGV